jgi:predicted enzyme related to lactoylglutathione lyase
MCQGTLTHLALLLEQGLSFPRNSGERAMIDGAHIIVYSKDAEADKAFLKNVLKFGHVDVGHGWLIFKLPPAEMAVHPSDENDLHELYLMTDDLDLEMARLKKAGVACEPVSMQGWGRLTRLALPGGGKIGLYQPRHARP